MRKSDYHVKVLYFKLDVNFTNVCLKILNLKVTSVNKCVAA